MYLCFGICIYQGSLTTSPIGELDRSSLLVTEELLLFPVMVERFFQIIITMIFVSQTDAGLSYSDLGCRSQPVDLALVMEQSAGCGPEGAGQ